MARIARAGPGDPHHVTQRGNRRQQTFVGDQDYGVYLELMAARCGRCGVAVRAYYLLLPNDVHLIVVPKAEDGLRRALGDSALYSAGERSGGLAKPNCG